MARFVVAAVDEIAPGARKIVEAGGVSLGIFNLGGEYFALRNRCPHQGGPLCEGKLWGSLEATVPGDFHYSRPGEIIACLWHGWEFDIRSGQSWTDPRRLRARSYSISVQSGSSLEADDLTPAEARVKGPYIAETYQITTDGSYLVVEVPTDSS